MLRRIGTVASLCKACRCRFSSAAVNSTVAHLPTGALAPGQFLLACGLRSSGALLSTEGDEGEKDEGEKRITEILVKRLAPSYINVRDISGGCGSMYEITIDSERFKGKRTLLQHRMVNEALGDDVVKSLHGLTIRIGNPEAKS